MRKGNPAWMRLIRDNKSHTGLSAAILLRNVRPKKRSGGRYSIARAEFDAGFVLNCDGFKVKPKVTVLIECHLNAMQAKAEKQRRINERALANSPMLM